jgi:anti-anti-sigma factor
MVTTEAAAGPKFTLTTEAAGQATVLVCKGRLTATVSDKFKSQVKALFPQGRAIILDLGGVNQIDSSGLGAVVSLWVSAQAANAPLKFYNLSPAVKRLLGTTQVLKTIEAAGAYLEQLPS